MSACVVLHLVGESFDGCKVRVITCKGTVGLGVFGGTQRGWSFSRLREAICTIDGSLVANNQLAPHKLLSTSIVSKMAAEDRVKVPTSLPP
jgi:hypothetical protein